MIKFVNEILCGDWIERLKELPAKVFHCVITSPPYWGQRNYGVDGQLGLEKTIEEHIEKLVLGFREVRRVMRDDAVLFLDYGDKYSANDHTGEWGLSARHKDNKRPPSQRRVPSGIPQGNLIGLAWRLALALQADGWILRSDIIWAKALSFCDKYSGSTMPESINGTRWERCRVKVKAGETGGAPMIQNRMAQSCGRIGTDVPVAQWQDCPGCPKCEANDGLVLRKGSWRPTRGHEYLFQLTKGSGYFCDMEAVREEQIKGAAGSRFDIGKTAGHQLYRAENGYRDNSGRNLRDVWAINPQAFDWQTCAVCGATFTGSMKRRIKTIVVDGKNKQQCPECSAVDKWLSHYATFAEALVEPCIKVATSEKGCCPECGANWARIVDKGELREHPARANRNVRNKADYDGKDYARRENTLGLVQDTTTLGWRPTCNHKAEPVPCLVLDPFGGSGTVGAVAARLGRNYTLIEINPDYIDKQAKARIREGETGISTREQQTGQMAMFKGKK